MAAQLPAERLRREETGEPQSPAQLQRRARQAARDKARRAVQSQLADALEKVQVLQLQLNILVAAIRKGPPPGLQHSSLETVSDLQAELPCSGSLRSATTSGSGASAPGLLPTCKESAPEIHMQQVDPGSPAAVPASVMDKPGVMDKPDVPADSGAIVGDACNVEPDVAEGPELPEEPGMPVESETLVESGLVVNAPGIQLEDDAVGGTDGARHPRGNSKRRRRDNAGGHLPPPDSEERHVDASAVSNPLQPLQTGESAGQPRLVVVVLEALLALTRASPKGTTTVTLLEEKVLALVGEPELEYSYFEECMDYLTKAQAVEYRRAGRGGLLRLGREIDAARRALLP